MNIRVLCVLLIATMLLALFSCKEKREDSIHPVAIDVWKPYENQSFRMIDSLIINASFKSQIELKNASIKILDENKENYGDLLNETPQNTYLDIDLKIPIVSLGFEKGGSFYLQFSGSNEETSAIRSIPFEVQDPDDSLNNIILIKKNLEAVNVEVYDRNLIYESDFVVNSDYAASDVSSEFQYLFVEGNYLGGINYLDIAENIFVLEIPAVTTPGVPYFTNIVYNNQIIYASTFDGGIFGYDKLGLQVYTAETPSEKYASKLFASEDYVYALLHKATHQDSSIGVYYKDTESLRKEVVFDGEFIDAVNTFEDFILILSYNSEEKYAIKEYHPEYDNFDLLKASNSYRFKSIEKMDNDNFLVLSESHVLQYQRSTNSLLELSENKNNLKIIRYNYVDKSIYGCSTDSIFVLNPATFDVENSMNLQDSLLNIHLLYNQDAK